MDGLEVVTENPALMAGVAFTAFALGALAHRWYGRFVVAEWRDNRGRLVRRIDELELQLDAAIDDYISCDVLDQSPPQ